MYASISLLQSLSPAKHVTEIFSAGISSSLVNMAQMFSGCESLISLDLTKFNITNVCGAIQVIDREKMVTKFLNYFLAK